MAKSQYTPAKVVEKARLISEDHKFVMLVVLSEGKSGFNTKASIKRIGDKETRALTGGRATFQDIEGGKMAFEKIIKEAKSQKWVLDTLGSSRNAFTKIPSADEVSKMKAPPKTIRKGTHARPTAVPGTTRAMAK